MTPQTMCGVRGVVLGKPSTPTQSSNVFFAKERWHWRLIACTNNPFDGTPLMIQKSSKVASLFRVKEDIDARVL